MSVSDVSGVRKKILALRKALSPSQIEILSEKITQRYISQLGKDFSFNHVGLYRHVHGEVDLTQLKNWLSTQQNCSIYYPRVVKKLGLVEEIEFVELQREMSWEKGPFGILEPAKEHPRVDGNILDLVFVPGVAFGQNGERIGMGKGYYDRFFAQYKKSYRVALAFDFQVLPRVDQNIWDQPVHFIVTENREFFRKE